MFKQWQQAFWKALTPDLMPDQPISTASTLDAAVLAALGGVNNLRSERRVALSRIRIELKDVARMDLHALRQAGVPGVMPLAGGVVHLLVGSHHQV
ncbi:PTS glucose transporter subunit IIB [Pseudomonas sp. SIMBA_077]